MEKIIETATEIIKKGGVIVCPTDTVYGLVCDATNKKAVDKIFKIKKRPKLKPLPIFVKDIKMAKELAEINKDQKKFLKKVWPGAVTARLKRRGKMRMYGVDKNTIAIRIPKSRLVLSLAKHIGPLAETSANISGQPASNNIKDILKQFEGQKYQLDLVINVGNLPKSNPSKIIDLTVKPYKILRD